VVKEAHALRKSAVNVSTFRIDAEPRSVDDGLNLGRAPIEAGPALFDRASADGPRPQAEVLDRSDKIGSVPSLRV
jgi:hypothetical protein